MDKSQVPTGFLLEYSVFGLESAQYDGINNDDDTIKGDGRIFELHNILWHSKVNNSATIDLTDTLFSKAFFAHRNTGAVPLTFVYQKYNRIRQTALSEGLFTIAADSVGILDVPGRSTSPYDTYEIFAFAPFKTKVTRFNAIPFTLPDELFYMQGINSVEIDFGDGAGFRNLSKGSTVHIYYATEGVKYLTARISTVNGLRTAKSVIDYKTPGDYSVPVYTWNIEVDLIYTDDIQYFGGSQSLRTNDLVIPCNNGSLIDRLLCSIRPNAHVEIFNGCDGVFDRPIIIVEGFDPIGNLDINEWRRRFSQSGFIETMRSHGFDFVFVDFTKNTTYIENNARVLEAVINQVNQTKVGAFTNTVIGFSMGGLVARWCLRDMEDRGIQHQVENYFSYDTPHQGANIPLGMQYIFKELVRDLPYLKWNSDMEKLNDAYNSPAARQMLVTYANYNNGPFNWFPDLNTLDPLRAAFAQRLQAIGYPQQTRNFGIAFGRGDNTANTEDASIGNQFTPANPFGPQDDIFWGGLGFFLVNAEAQASAVPENGDIATIAYYSFMGLTFRKIFGLQVVPQLRLRVRRFDYRSQNPYDNAMGSFEITQSQFRDSWVKGLAASPTTFDHDGHNFAATVSALDLQNQGYGLVNNWQSDNMFFNVDNEVVNVGQVNGNNLINPALSPFFSVITSTTETPWFGWNYYHNTDISAQFATFIERNILNAQPVNCAGTNGLCGRNPSVSGPAVVCTTADFLINDLPNGVVIIWTSVNGRFRVIGGQGTPNVTIERISGGSDILRLEITNACGATRTINTDVFLGVPAQPGTIREVLVDYYIGKIQVEIDPVPGATSYNWYKNGVLQTSSHGTFAQISITRRVCDVGYGIEVEAVNACGASPKRYKGVYVPCDYYYTVSPNPAGNTVTVSANESKGTRSTSNENVAFDEVRIYDAYGNLKKLQKFNNVKAATINIAALSNGTYFIEIGNESFAERQQLFIHK